MRAVLIMNPTSGVVTPTVPSVVSKEHEEAILAVLRRYGIEPELMYTTPEEPGMSQAKQAAAQGGGEGAEVVIAAGGDGTIHEVATGLIGTQSTLGIIPLGTMNNLATSLNIPATIEAACEVIAKGEVHPIDVGEINKHTFIEVAGVGLEAALSAPGEEIRRHGFLSTLRAIITGLKILLAYKPARLRITFDKREHRSYKAIQVTICNSPYHGLHFHAALDPVMDDGLLDVVIYKNFSKLEYIKHAISISQGRRVLEPKAVYRQVKSLRITTDQPMEIHADGLPHGYTPAVVRVLPGALRVLVPGVPAPGLDKEKDAGQPANQAPTSPGRQSRLFRVPLVGVVGGG